MMTTAHYFDLLRPEVRRTLAAHLGLPARASVSAIERAVADPAKERLLMRAAGDRGADRVMRWALSSGPLRNGAVDIDDQDLEGEENEELLVALVDAGVILLRNGYLWVLPPLVAALRPRAASSCFRDTPDRGDFPTGLAMALLVSLVAHDPPRVNADGSVHASWVTRFKKRWGDDGVRGLSRPTLEHAARRAGLFRVRDDADRPSLVPAPSRIDAVLGGDSSRLALAMLGLLDESGARLLRCVGLVARQAAASGGSTTYDRVQEEIEARMADGYWAQWPESPWDTIRSLQSLQVLGLVAIEEAGGVARLRRTEPPPRGTGRWIVQPAFDVLVPWDVPPAAAARLGLVAEVEAIDRVCRYRLTPESVARGASLLGSGEAVLRAIEEAASGPLAGNVRTTIEGWLARFKPLRVHRGDVVFAADDEQRALLRRVAPDAVEVVPGAFCLRGSLTPVVSAFRKQGTPVEGAGTAEGARSAPAAFDLERAVRDAEATLTKAMEAPAPKAAAPRRKSPLRDEVDDDDFEDDDDAPVPIDSRARSRHESSSRAPPPKTVTPGSAPSPREPVWQPVLPGRLREMLGDAIETGRPIDLLYVNAKNESSERRVRPVEVAHTRHGDFLVTVDATNGQQNSLSIDRITAIRR